MKASSALAPALHEASRIVARVAAGDSLVDDPMRPVDATAGVSRAALLDLTHGTLRRYGRVQALVKQLSQRGRPDATLEALLWCAIYALDSGRYADYTVVDQAVKACALLERWSAKGYVNALLRRLLRDRNTIERGLEHDAEARFQHPRWWIDLVQRSYPEQWEDALLQGNRPPPMCLRANRRRTTPERYLARLSELGIAAHALEGEALLLEQPVPVDRLPGFAEGEISVQDLGAQRAMRCLQLAQGQRVLDACAAPGGKAAHILESCDVALTAVDIDGTRAARLASNLQRLGLEANVTVADVSQFAASGAGPFDRILADVPCSGSGIVRRHPDIKWLRRETDLEGFVHRQSDLLDALWRLLAPGGKLLYATCSVFPEENDGVIDAFVARTAQATRGRLADGGPAQWLPNADHDGFFYALIEKNA